MAASKSKGVFKYDGNADTRSGGYEFVVRCIRAECPPSLVKDHTTVIVDASWVDVGKPKQAKPTSVYIKVWALSA